MGKAKMIMAVALTAFVDGAIVGRKGKLIPGGLSEKAFKRLEKINYVREADRGETLESDIAAIEAKHKTQLDAKDAGHAAAIDALTAKADRELADEKAARAAEVGVLTERVTMLSGDSSALVKQLTAERDSAAQRAKDEAARAGALQRELDDLKAQIAAAPAAESKAAKPKKAKAKAEAEADAPDAPKADADADTGDADADDAADADAPATGVEGADGDLLDMGLK